MKYSISGKLYAWGGVVEERTYWAPFCSPWQMKWGRGHQYGATVKALLLRDKEEGKVVFSVSYGVVLTFEE